MIQLTIDGHRVEAPAGSSVLEAAQRAGIYIPHLCAHPDLPTQGGCRLCTVAVENADRPLKACETPVADGMVVHTTTDEVKQIRTVALELILAPHPKDCTSCAAYLNCELQALMQYTGVAHSRMREIDKETARIGTSDAVLTKEMFRCIQCTRCIRACDDLRGVSVLQMNFRDGEAYVGTRDDVPHSETDCRYCSACVAVCPTGTIMDTPGLFGDAPVPRGQGLVPCTRDCPAHTDIPLYLDLAGEGRYAESTAVIREKLTFPLSLGYVCSHPCEVGCKRGKVDWPISIREVKRFAVENDTEHQWRQRTSVAPPTGKRVAVVGGGPAGLTGAYYLARKGHAVTVLERLPKPGGMLTYGIPKYRLPQDVVDQEVAILVDDAPFTIETGVDVTDVARLRAEGYDAVLVSVGAQAGRRPPAYDGSWENAYDAVDLLRRWTMGERPDVGDTLTVFGGGNVAFDCARTARRLGVKNVRVVCLEPEGKMMADDEEIREGRSEGVEIVPSVTLQNLNIMDARVVSLSLSRVNRFEFTAAGLQLDLVDGSEFDLGTESLIFATGQKPDITTDFGLEQKRGGLLTANTGTEGVFAAGDVVTGTTSIVAAVAGGRTAAADIDRYLGGDGDIEDTFYDRPQRDPRLGVMPDFLSMTRTDCRTPEAVRAETSRCLHCDLRQDIETVKYWTDPAYRGGKAVRS